LDQEVPWAVVIKVMFLILKNGKVLSFLHWESSLSAIAIAAGTGSKAFVKGHLGKSCLYGVLFGYSQVRNQKGLFHPLSSSWTGSTDWPGPWLWNENPHTGVFGCMSQLQLVGMQFTSIYSDLLEDPYPNLHRERLIKVGPMQTLRIICGFIPFPPFDIWPDFTAILCYISE